MNDKDMNLVELIKDFADESKCRAYLEALRWPKGVICPTCNSEKVYRIVKRDQFVCDSCSYQFSVTAGTIFHDTHLPLWKWFLATCLLCESKKGMSACQIQRSLGVSYKTAWYLCHRIRAAMLELAPKKLGGTVEIDETYIGGKKRRWRARSDKQVVIGIRQRNGDLRLIHAEDAKSATVREIINANVGGHVEVIMTDESAIYPFALDRCKRISTTRLTTPASTHTVTFTQTPWKARSRCSSEALSARGIRWTPSISRPISMKCAFGSITAKTRIFSAIRFSS
jgi:transposase-like protein